MTTQLQQDHEELKQLAAMMYHVIRETEHNTGRCLNPSSEDCMGSCDDCGYYDNPLRNVLIRLGVPIDELQDSAYELL